MRKNFWVVFALLAVMAARLVTTAWQKSATYDEAFYISYGYSLLKTGDYRFSIDKPPLVPVISALPLVFLKPEFNTADPDWQKAAGWMNSKEKNPWGEPGSYRWSFSLKFLFDNTLSVGRMLFFSRVSVIFAVIFLGLLAFLLTKSQFGPAAGYYFLFFYTFCPNILGNSFLTTEDSIVSALIYISALSFLALLDKPSYKTGALTGLFTALALLSKHTALFLFPVFLVLLLIAVFTKKIALKKRIILEYLAVFAVSFLIIAFTIALAYKFAWFKLYFINIKNTLLYQGRGQAAFCWGNYSYTGFWYYYLVCLLFKTPLPLFLLALLAPFKLFNTKKLTRDRVIKLLGIIVPAVLIIAFASINKIQLGMRYILPAYVFILCLCALVAEKYKAVSYVMCAWLAFNSLSIHPDYMAYFNGLTYFGGGGQNFLVDSNMDWGQDLRGLKKYIEKEKVTDVVMSYYGSGLAKTAGFEFQDLFSFGLWGEKKHVNAEKPQKEILAVSATNLQGLYFSNMGHDLLGWAKSKEPAKIIGGSIFVYDITNDAFAHQRLANVYFFTGQLDKALRESLRTVELKPDDGLAHLILAFMYVDYNPGEAVGRFRQIVKVNPALTFMYNNVIKKYLLRLFLQA